MNSAEVRAVLEQVGALMTGHFKLSSGRHSDEYVQKQRLFGYPRYTAAVGEAIAKKIKEVQGGEPFNVVLSPAVGAITLGHEVARAADARFLVAEREDGGFTLRRGQSLGGRDRVLVVEDVVTTGGSAAEVVDLVRASPAGLAAVACLVDRSQIELPFRLHALLTLQARDWDPAECPGCAAGTTIDSPGSRYLT